ncbi:hypothetical protein DPMN_013217 [Dreissena polymorpha]|uniref:Uncharacterized protein n=1 Tax=Dreissena polymorpha TaxID=45954 RepID=A0A9D4N9H5_DREPO|nr:hypothetical protein DPMN_013217 [Dreissena polymorpha]
MKEQSEEIKELKRIIHDIQTDESLTPVKLMTPKHDSLAQQQRIHNNYTGDHKSTMKLLAQEID